MAKALEAKPDVGEHVANVAQLRGLVRAARRLAGECGLATSTRVPAGWRLARAEAVDAEENERNGTFDLRKNPRARGMG
jgi:hypothetical protein